MNWKRLVLTGLSGLVFGAVTLVARKQIRKKSMGKPKAIPSDVDWVAIETEKTELTYRGHPYWSSALYTCHSTQFQVWSLLKSAAGDSGSSSSQRIYHVSPVIEFESQQDQEVHSVAEEKFYATLHLKGQKSPRTLPDQVALGAEIEFHKCHVGGSMNGVETGEKVITPAPVARIEFSP